MLVIYILSEIELGILYKMKKPSWRILTLKGYKGIRNIYQKVIVKDDRDGDGNM